MTRGFDKMTDAEAAAWNELTPREMTFVSPEAVKAVLRAQAAAASRAQYVAELEKRLSEPASAEPAIDCGECACLPGVCDKEQDAANDRDRFEAYYAKRTSCEVADVAALRRGDDYTLTASYLQTLWEGWKAHAELTK